MKKKERDAIVHDINEGISHLQLIKQTVLSEFRQMCTHENDGLACKVVHEYGEDGKILPQFTSFRVTCSHCDSYYIHYKKPANFKEMREGLEQENGRILRQKSKSS